MTFRKLLGLFAVIALGLGIKADAQLTTPVYYGLNGTIVSLDGTPFNGMLSVQLARPTAMNTCASPVQIVSQQRSLFKIVNGVIQNGTAAHFLTNACLTPSIPYYAQLYDTSNKLVYSDNWFFPISTATNIDVGTLSDVTFAGGIGGGGQTNSSGTPLIVAVPSAVVTNPLGQQTITQPGSTALSINNLTVTGVFDASLASPVFSGTMSGPNATFSGNVSGVSVLQKQAPVADIDFFRSTSDGHSGQDTSYAFTAACNFMNTIYQNQDWGLAFTSGVNSTWNVLKTCTTDTNNHFLIGNGAILEPVSGGAGGKWGSSPVTITNATLTAGSANITYSSTAGLSADMAIGGRGVPNGSYIETATTTAATLSLNNQLRFEGVPSNGSATVTAVSNFAGLQVGQCFSLPATGTAALWVWSSSATQACISSMDTTFSGRSVTFDHTITIAGFALSRSPVTFNAVAGTTWTASLTAQAVAPVIQVVPGNTNQPKWQGYRVGWGISDLTIADPAFYNPASANHSLGRSITGVQGLQVFNFDRLHIRNLTVQGLTGSAFIQGGDDYNGTYCSSSNSYLGSPRESDFYDIQLWENGDWATGQAQWIIAGPQCQNSNASDQPNQLDYYGLKAGSPWGPNWVVTTYNSSVWYPSNVPGPRQIQCYGCQFEGSGRTNAYASVPARMLDFQVANDITIFGGEIAASTFKYCLICVDNAKSLTLDGVTLGLNGAGTFSSAHYMAAITNGGTTATYVSGPSYATGFPTGGQWDGQDITITNGGTTNLLASPTGSVSSNGQTLTFTSAFTGSTCTSGSPCQLTTMYAGYPILITGTLSQLVEKNSWIGSSGDQTINIIYPAGAANALQNSFVAGSCPAVISSDTLRWYNSSYCEQGMQITSWSDTGTPKELLRLMAPSLAANKEVEIILGAADAGQQATYFGYNYVAGAASDTNYGWLGSSSKHALQWFPSTGVIKTGQGLSTLDDGSGNMTVTGGLGFGGGSSVSSSNKICQSDGTNCSAGYVATGNCTMTAGACSAQSLGHTYNTAPNCTLTWTGTGTLAGTLKVTSTTTTVTPASSTGTDTAQVNWVCGR